jgi:hypothetical protein
MATKSEIELELILNSKLYNLNSQHSHISHLHPCGGNPRITGISGKLDDI